MISKDEKSWKDWNFYERESLWLPTKTRGSNRSVKKIDTITHQKRILNKKKGLCVVHVHTTNKVGVLSTGFYLEKLINWFYMVIEERTLG